MDIDTLTNIPTKQPKITSEDHLCHLVQAALNSDLRRPASQACGNDDASGNRRLKSLTLSVERLRKRDVTVWLVGMNPSVFAMVARSQLGKTLGRDAMLFNLR